VNRLLKNIALLFAVAFLSCLHAEAQSCGPWTNVTSWKVNYTTSASASGVENSGFTWTISQNASANGSLGIFTNQCPKLMWGTVNLLSGSGSINDQGVESDTSCPPGSPQNDTISLVGGGAFQPPDWVTLVIDTTNNTYEFLNPLVAVSSTYTFASCGVISQTGTGAFDATPLLSTEPFSLTFPLPTEVGELSQQGITATGLGAVGVSPGVPVPFTVSFTFTPILAKVDHDCKHQGGSYIGCQNQSLGEDVPVVGTGFFLHYESDRAPGSAGGNSIATADAAMIGGWTLNVHHAYDPGSNTLFLGDGDQRSTWQLASPPTYNGSTLVTSQDGSEVYTFDGATGHHLQTLRPMTGAVKYQFGYDAAGNLITVTDGSGNITTIQRDGSEHATAILSPFLQTTTLVVDSNGFLSDVIDPATHTSRFNNTSTGLITGRTDANGDAYNYLYDTFGRLITDSDPAGGSTLLTRTDSNSGYSVTTATALGRTATYQVTTGGTAAEQLTNTWPNGLQATETDTPQNGRLSEITTLPDGTNDTTTLSADPRWGLQAPVPTSGSLTKGSLVETIAGSRTASFTAGNPFSLTAQTDTLTLNGRKYTTVFTTSTRTYLNTTPVKRTTTTVLDSLERISSTQLGTLLPVKFAYDGKGRVSTITQGTRTASLAYDSNSFLASSEDPLKLTTSFTHDAAGRLLTTTLPDGRVITNTYDANGNLTSVTPPGKSAHDFAYTPVNLISTYTPPVVSGTGATTYAYDVDRSLTTITRPDGETINYGYDSAGRLSSATTPTETLSYGYDATTGNRSSASISGGEAIAYGYNGPLPISSTWTGTVAGNISRAYNNNFWVTSKSINNSNTINFTYDNDGLIAKAGTLVLKHNAKDGLITGTTLGSATDTRTYDTLGELIGLTAKYQTPVLYSVKLTRDADGRITVKAETIGSKKNTFTYSYDAAGRLTAVNENGTSLSSYTYDSNSNRLTATTSSGTVTGIYDAQDRLLTYGTASFTYTANGELASQAVGSQTTSYQYDVLGNLIAATLPNATKITYIIDPENHRVGKEVNGVLQTGFLYDGNRIVAQLNGNNAIVSQFIYASQATVPDYMISGGVTYRMFSDQLGTPRLVVNTSTGAITEQINYDEFGNVISDTNPGFQPFGFAGGLYDQDTKFVRFGARDYNPALGRWTAKDPILFAGGDTNLYGYVLTDPVNSTDPSGLNPFTTIGNWYDSATSSLQSSFDSWTSSIWKKMQIKQRCVCNKNQEGGNGVTAGELATDTGLHLGIEAGGEAVGAPVAGPLITLVNGALSFAEGYFALQENADRNNSAGGCPP